MKILLKLDTGFAGCEHEDEIEIDDEEIKGLSESELYDYLYENYGRDMISNYIELYYEVIEEVQE